MANAAKVLALAVAVALVACPALAAVPVVVPVGDPGNAATTTGVNANGWGPSASIGAVGYRYAIGTYEVTNTEYTEFLNAVADNDTYGLYNTEMGSTYGGITRSGSSPSYTYAVKANYGNRPVNFVTYWDACRYVNWLQKNRPTGAQGTNTTETGAYALNGYNGVDGRAIARTAGTLWALPTQDEWYKAAYYKGGSTNAGYWKYATASDTCPASGAPATYPTGANYYGTNFAVGGTFYTTIVGAYAQADSPYGTYDQNGNVAEWNETVTYIAGATWSHVAHARRGSRGGAWTHGNLSLDGANAFYGDMPDFSNYNTGFRVVYLGSMGAEVVNANIFHNQSAYDGNNAAANASDDGAIIAGKTPQQPGQASAAANRIACSHGINGLMFDIDGLALPAQLNAANDFIFQVSSTGQAGTWTAAPAPVTLAVRAGAGTAGSDRVTIIWANQAIANKWLRVEIKATANTGLEDPYVCYWGNLRGDTNADGSVGVSDLLLVQQNYLKAPGGNPPRDNRADVTCDNNVNLFDLLLVRQRYLQTLPSFTAAP